MLINGQATFAQPYTETDTTVKAETEVFVKMQVADEDEEDAKRWLQMLGEEEDVID
jgi:hypothetical protein